MAIALALSAALAYGSADFVGGLAARRTSPLLTAFGAQLTGLIVLLVAMPFLGPSTPTGRDLAFGAAAGLFGGIGLVLLYRALAAGPMSVVAPTTALSASVVPILAGVILGERPGALAFVFGWFAFRSRVTARRGSPPRAARSPSSASPSHWSPSSSSPVSG